MPTISIQSKLLFEKLGKVYTSEEFDQLCFDFGIELDDIEMEEGVEVYKIDIPANRYDLLCLEGLGRALRVFLGDEPAPVFKAIQPSPEVAASTRVVVRQETAQIRKFVVCAVLRNLSMDEESYQSCLDLQDQLHRNICRRRTLVAIGTHDLDAIEGPFTYEAQKPEDIRFQHLFAEEEMNGKEMLDWFRNDPAGKHIKEYTGIIYDSPVYPVIYDKNRTVMSLPPIINGAASKIGPKTKNMFIECTATDLTKAKVVLNTIVAMFSRYCSEPDSVEQVEVVYDQPVVPGGQSEAISSMLCPDLSSWKATANVANVCSTIGMEMEPERMLELCDRMQLGPASLDEKKETLTVTVPVTRSDIMHEVDIIEDIAIAFGFNNITRTVPVSHKAGKELPINLLADLLRYELSRQGFMEILSLGLCSAKENFDQLKRTNDGSAVSLSNPKTIEFEVVRTSLLPGMLKTLASNLSLKISDGIKLFECSDVVLRDTKNAEQLDVGCRNERRLVALHAGLVSSFETIHGLVDRLMQVLAVVPSKEYSPEAAASPHVQRLISDDACIGEYKLEPLENPTFFPGSAGRLVWKQTGASEFTELGVLGVLHPDVLANFALPYPCTVLEMNIEPFVRE